MEAVIFLAGFTCGYAAALLCCVLFAFFLWRQHEREVLLQKPYRCAGGMDS